MNVRLFLIWLLLTMLVRMLSWTTQPSTSPKPDKYQVLACAVKEMPRCKGQ
jgi:hypothetical protein